MNSPFAIATPSANRLAVTAPVFCTEPVAFPNNHLSVERCLFSGVRMAQNAAADLPFFPQQLQKQPPCQPANFPLRFIAAHLCNQRVHELFAGIRRCIVRSLNRLSTESTDIRSPLLIQRKRHAIIKEFLNNFRRVFRKIANHGGIRKISPCPQRFLGMKRWGIVVR